MTVKFRHFLKKNTKMVYCSIPKRYNLVMKVYHGSKRIIDKPIYQGSTKDNDYGPAFYLTKDIESAKEWANRNKTIGYINYYDIDDSNLNVLDLTDTSKYSVLNWLAVILKYRELPYNFKNSFAKRLKFIEENYYIDVTKYDVVIGFRADDAYFRFPLDFVVGNLTLEQLEYAFNLGELGIQYVLMSERAFHKIKFKKAELVDKKYIDKYYKNVFEATKRYDELDRDSEGTKIFDLMKEAK